MNVENIEISQTLPVLQCDYASLKNWALAMTDKYKNLLITENQITDIKKDMAELNKAKQKLERARIDAVKAVSAPIKEFEAQIKDICAIFEKTYANLGNQVNEFEQAQKDEKRKAIQVICDERVKQAIAEHPEMDGKIALSVNQKWLNKTATMKSIEQEINAAIEAQVNANLEIARQEKAETERRLLIENTVKSANEKYKINAPVSKFMGIEFTDISLDAVSVLSKIDGMIKAQAENKKREAELAEAAKERNIEVVTGREFDGIDPLSQPLQPAEWLKHDKNPVQEERTPEKTNSAPIQAQSGMICLSLHAYYRPEQESEVRKILEQNQFMRIVRQLKGMGLQVDFRKDNI